MSDTKHVGMGDVQKADAPYRSLPTLEQGYGSPEADRMAELLAKFAGGRKPSPEEVNTQMINVERARSFGKGEITPIYELEDTVASDPNLLQKFAKISRPGQEVERISPPPAPSGVISQPLPPQTGQVPNIYPGQQIPQVPGMVPKPNLYDVEVPTHFADGGDIEPRSNVVDETGQLVSLPNSQIPEALQSGFSQPSQADLARFQEQQQNTGAIPAAKAAAAGALRGATFGLSDIALTSPEVLQAGPGQPLIPKETLSKLQQYQPEASMAGEFAGALGSMSVSPEAAGVKAAMEAVNTARTTGDTVKLAQAMKALDTAKATLTAADLGNPVSALSKIGQKVTQASTPTLINPESSSVVAKILQSTGKVGAKALGSAVEGAVYGAGQAVTENALGDPNLHGESLLHDIGYGALFGGVLGGALGLGENAYDKVFQIAGSKDAIIENAIHSPPHPTSIPTSLDEIVERNKLGSDLGFDVSLPAKDRLLETNSILAGDSQFPAHALQAQSLDSPYARKFYKTFLESGDERAKDLAVYEANQKQEGIKLAEKFIQDIAPDASLTDDASIAGRKAVNAFEHQYSETKLGQEPFWAEFDKAAQNEVKNPSDILKILHDTFPDSAKYISLDPEGHFVVPYKAHMPFTPVVYKSLKDVVESLNEPGLKISELRDLRKKIRASIDPTKGEEASQLSSLGRSLMDIIQNRIDQYAPNMEVREGFKTYAINEQNKQFLERDVFRGRLGDKSALGKGISPEDVIPRFFADSDTVRAARQVLGADKFDEITANYLKHLMSKSTDATKGFSSNKFAGQLRSKLPELTEALSQHPEELKKLQAITDKMRILPDAPPANPSGTAMTANILQKMQRLGGFLTPEGLASIPGEMLKAIGEKIQAAQTRSHMDQILSGKQILGSEQQSILKQRQYAALANIERTGQRVMRTIDRGTKAIFDINSPVRGIAIKHLSAEEKKDSYEKATDSIRERSSNPDGLLESLNENTRDLHNIAPNITGSLQDAAVRATNFLASKLPIQSTPAPLSAKETPSATEIAKFNRYQQTVEHPLQVLEHLRNGTISKEQVETLINVYPKTYEHMVQAISQHLSSPHAQQLPYQRKQALSMFTGMDLTNTLKHNNIQAMQGAFRSPASNPPPPAAVPHPARGLSKLNQANSALTPLQQTERRGQR